MEYFIKMKRILLLLLGIFFPWIAMLIEEKPIPALACLALQLTFIGWIPASIWATNVVKQLNPKQKQQPADIEQTQNTEKEIINPAPSTLSEPINTEENKLTPPSKQDTP
jgi:uncharacterized membrane protein YqaE (UPF0057 family)